MEVGWTSPPSAGGITIDGEDVYYIGTDGYLYNIRDGRTRWQRSVGPADNMASIPLLHDESAIVPGDDGYIYSFSKSGRIEWKSKKLYPDGATHGPDIFTAPTVAGGIILTGGANGDIHAIDPDSGALLWQTHIGGHGVMPASDGQHLFVTGGDSTSGTYGVQSLSLLDGEVRWEFGPSKQFSANPPAVADGRVYALERDGVVYAFDKSDGTVTWKRDLTSKFGIHSPAVHDGRVFVGGESGEFYALDATSGSTIWSFSFETTIEVNPVVTDDAVFVSDRNGNVRALRPRVGTPHWSFDIGRSPRQSIAVSESGLVIDNHQGQTHYLQER